MTPYYTQIACTPTDTGWIAGYMQTIPGLVAKHGGRYLYQTGEYDRIEGVQNRPGLLVLIEWPDKKAAEAFYDDPAYQPHKRARQSGAVTEMFLVPSGP
jgi:uncharacterized protein (DUF1330 family)